MALCNVIHAQIEFSRSGTACDLFLLIQINKILIITHSGDDIGENDGVRGPKGPSLPKNTKKKLKLMKTIRIKFIRTTENSQSKYFNKKKVTKTQ